MKALGFLEHGGIECMKLLDLPTPTPKANEVLIKVKASAFNHLDIWVRKGWPGLHLELPHISGSDAAGEIVELGSEVKNWQIGDRVAVDPGINTREDAFTLTGRHSVSPGFCILGEQVSGTHAEYLAVPQKNLMAIPESISFQTAAAAGLVAVTTWRMLFEQAALRLGERVLIVGAGGGVNNMALQMAKLAGCDVTVLAGGSEKVKKAQGFGADYVVDYKTDSDWVRTLHKQSKGEGYDVIVDNVGQATLANSLKLVKRGGRVVVVGNTTGAMAEIDIRYLFTKQISLIGSTMGSHQNYLDAMRYVLTGQLQPVIDCELPLSDGISGMERLERGEQFGKIVLVN